MKQLADIAPLIMVEGNHDIHLNPSRASSLSIFDVLHYPNIKLVREPEMFVVETDSGPFEMLAIPYPIPQRLLNMDAHRGKGKQGLVRATAYRVEQIIAQSTEQLSGELPALIAAHITVTGAQWGSERGFVASNEVGIPLDSFVREGWDYVALGHIHKPQDLNAGSYPPVVYSGSMERINFGEEGQRKGFCIVELARGATQYEYVDVAARPFHTIRVDVVDHENPTQVIVDALQDAEVAGSIVKLVVRCNKEQRPHIRDKQYQVLLSDAMRVERVFDVVRHERDRLSRTMGDMAVSEASVTELLGAYMEANDISVASEFRRRLFETAAEF